MTARLAMLNQDFPRVARLATVLRLRQERRARSVNTPSVSSEPGTAHSGVLVTRRQLDVHAAKRAKQPKYQQNDQQGTKDSAQACSTIAAIAKIAAAAEQQ